jgi:nucleoside-diphosphate kinase
MEEYNERTLLLVKPDGVRRGLVGECVKRFEQRGLTLRGLKMIRATEAQMRKHYSGDDAWLTQLGQRALDDCVAHGADPLEAMGATEPRAAGKLVLESLISFMTSGPVTAMVVSGMNAVSMARKIVGHTIPQKADIGSIRGDYSIDTPMCATLQHRAIENIMHASGNGTEAEAEIAVWFLPEELI